MPSHAHGPTDPELATILPAIVGADGSFGHRQHIHLAFVAVHQHGKRAWAS